MALELKIAVDVEGNAKRELAAIESGIKKVESAAKSTTDPINKLTDGISGLTDEQRASNEEWLKSASQMGSTQRMADQLRDSETKLTSTTDQLAHSVGLGSTAMLKWAGAAAGAGAALVGMTAFAVESIREYDKQTGALNKTREAVNGFAQAWNNFEAEVGRRIIGGGATGAVDGTLNLMTDALEALTPAMAQAFTMATGLEQFGNRARQAANEWFYLSAALAQARGQLDNISVPSVGAPTGFGSNGTLKVPQLPGLSNGDWIKNWQPNAAPRSSGGGSSRAVPVPTPWGWAQLDIPDVTPGAPGYLPSNWNPFSSGASIPNSGGLPYYMGNLSRPDLGMPTSLPGATGIYPGGGSGGGWMNTLRGAYGYGMGLYDAGMNVWNSTDEGGAGSRALKGAASGAMAGTMIMPGIGTAIGAGVGALVGAIRGWLAPTEYEKRSQQLEKDRASATGILSTPGLGRMWDSMGGNVPFGFDFLKTQAYHDPVGVRGYLDDMLQKHERLQAAMEKYGISWEQLGSKAKQSQIDTMAEELILDFDVLVQAGADTNMVIEKMGGSINDFVQAALRTGSEVPAAMKPMIEQMIQMGLLTDETGEVFTDLEDTGITFAKTMTQGFDSIVEAINRVAVALGVTIPDAAGKAADAIMDIPHPDLGNDVYMPGGGDGGVWQPESYAVGGVVRHPWRGAPAFASGGAVPIWAHAGEFVMSRAAVHRIGASNLAAMNSGRGGMVTAPIVINLDRQRFAELMAETVLVG